MFAGRGKSPCHTTVGQSPRISAVAERRGWRRRTTLPPRRGHCPVMNEPKTPGERVGSGSRLHAPGAAVDAAATATAIFYPPGAAEEVESLTTRLQALRGIPRL